MKQTKFTAGDPVIYNHRRWIVMDQVQGMVWISRFGERKQVSVGEIEAVEEE